MKRGTIVKSLAGHDKGTHFIVLWSDNEYAIIADGKRKTIEKPKKKKLKHLKEIGVTADLSAYNPLYDAHIKKELRSLLNKGGCSLG